MKNLGNDKSGELTGETWLIREDMIRPGDVLLTKGRTLISEAISLLSDGRFSHVAVFVSPVNVFESYDLVEHAWLHSVGYTIEGNIPVRWAILPHNPQEAELWRHPEIDTIAEDRFQEIYGEMMEEHWGMDYSLYARLIPLAQLPEGLKRIGTKAVEWYDNYWEQAEIPGPFCSELVAELFRRLPLKMFESERPPANVSPNDFTISKFRKVEGAIVERKSLLPLCPLEAEKPETFAKMVELASLGARQVHDQKVAFKGLDDFGELIKNTQEQTHDWIRSMIHEQGESIRKVIARAKAVPTPLLYLWVSRLVSNFNVISAGLLKSIDNRPNDEQAFVLWMKAYDKVCISTARLLAIANSRRLKLLDVALSDSKHWFRAIRRYRARQARGKMLYGIRSNIRFHISSARTHHFAGVDKNNL